MNLRPQDEKRFEAEIVELIRTGRMPSLEQVQAAIESTRQEFLPLFHAARTPGAVVLPIRGRKT